MKLTEVAQKNWRRLDGPVQLSAGRLPRRFAAIGLISAFGDGNLMFKRAGLLFVVIQCEGGNANGFHD
jgi:hypothetical protein